MKNICRKKIFYFTNAKRTAQLLFLLILCFACKDKSPAISSTASGYLNELLSIMQTNSINRNAIDWTQFRDQVFGWAGAAQTISDTYPAIQVALINLGDHHSFFIEAGGTQSLYNTPPTGCTGTVQPDVNPPDSIGYIRVPAFNILTHTVQQANDFAQSLQDAIRDQDKDYLKGWLVDLRGNTGGDMWPMLAGFGPIAGSGRLGYFIDGNGAPTDWGYTNGNSVVASSVVNTASHPYTLIKPDGKVAVLIDGLTSSSGEAITVAFEGRANTRLFGSSVTCGLSTANENFSLSDGAQLYLTVSVDADRTKKSYGGSIVPDELSNDAAAAVVAAIAWIRN